MIIAIAIGMMGCVQDSNDGLFKNTNLHNPKIVVIDQCEYIQFRTHNLYDVITHKGNCNNPIHKHKVSQDEKN
jgi:hypothetical protein